MAKGRILIVEDEPITAMDESETLTSMGYEVVAVVHSGEAAIRSAGEHRPDVVLMDIKLAQGMDGITAALGIQGLYDIPVVFVTAHGNKEQSQSGEIAVPAGYGYIVKPFTEQELKHNIDLAMATKEKA